MKRHPLTIIGAAITTLSAVVFVFVYLLDAFGLHTNPYIGIVFFLVLPAFFVLGLMLVPLGIYLDRRRRAKGLEPHHWPRLDLNSPAHRRAVAIVAVLTIVNGLIVTLAAARGIEFMDSPQFCGQVCHTVMEPEFVAYQDGPHSRVRCVDCHIGPGASWFVKSKLDGTRQVIAVMRGTYSRPIPSPVHDLRPARDTCEQCHWPQKFLGDRPLVRTKSSDDEKNTRLTTVLVMKLGGRGANGANGIHGRHLDGSARVAYATADPKRQV